MPERDRNGMIVESAALGGAPPRLVEDLLLVAHLDEEPMRAISEQLSSSAGMLSQDRIAEIVNQHLAGEDAEAVARIVANVAPAEIEGILGLVDEAARRHPTGTHVPADSTASKLRNNLSVLVQDYPALRLMHKAQRLIREIGNELRSVIFVCDLRPVYDDGHTEVVGFIPLVNMQIGYVEQNGDDDFFEVTLTGDELQQFLGRAQDAANKLQILENMLHGSSDTEEGQ